MGYMFWESWVSLTKNSKDTFSCLVLGFLLGSLCLLEGALSVQMKSFLKLNMHIYIQN